MNAGIELRIDIPADEWLTANGRYHWRAKAKRTAALRRRGALTARAARLPNLGRTLVTTHVGYPRAGRADASNAAPTAKALVDGLVDAGIWPDDDHRFVIDGGYRIAPKTGIPGVHTITLELTEHP